MIIINSCFLILKINNFGTLSATAKTIKELANGQIFIDLIQKLMAKSDCANEFNEIQNGSQTDINIRFELIKFVFRGKYLQFSTSHNSSSLVN